MKPLLKLSFALAAAFTIAMLPATAHAEEDAGKVKYQPPAGFAGHKWGEPRASFDRLPSTPVGVGAAWMRALESQTTQSDMACAPGGKNPGPRITGAFDGCNFASTLMRLRQDYEGGGFYVLSEYSIEEQGFRFGAETDGVMLHPVIYQFCANWQKGLRKKEPPPNFDSLNQFCGMKFKFQSETLEQLRALPGDYLTNYDRVLDKLLAKFGRPEGFVRRGRVFIEKAEGEAGDTADRKFGVWRWCPAHGNGFHTECAASVVLTLDPATGVGTVLYSAPQLWEFAYAREYFGFKDDPLYQTLHARK